MTTEKLSVTVDAGIAERVRSLAGPRGVSAFVDRALHHEVARCELRVLLDEVAAVLGPPDESLVIEADAALSALERRTRGGTRRRASAG